MEQPRVKRQKRCRNDSAPRTASPEDEDVALLMDPEQPEQPEESGQPEESEEPEQPELGRENNILGQLAALPKHLEAIGNVGQSVMEKLQHLEAKLDNLGQVRFN